MPYEPHCALRGRDIHRHEGVIIPALQHQTGIKIKLVRRYDWATDVVITEASLFLVEQAHDRYRRIVHSKNIPSPELEWGVSDGLVHPADRTGGVYRKLVSLEPREPCGRPSVGSPHVYLRVPGPSQDTPTDNHRPAGEVAGTHEAYVREEGLVDQVVLDVAYEYGLFCKPIFC